MVAGPDDSPAAATGAERDEPVWKRLSAEAAADLEAFPLPSATATRGSASSSAAREATPPPPSAASAALASAKVTTSALPAAVRAQAGRQAAGQLKGGVTAELSSSDSAAWSSPSEVDAEELPTRRQLLLERLKAHASDTSAKPGELSESEETGAGSPVRASHGRPFDADWLPDSSQRLPLRSVGGTAALRMRPRRASLAERRVVSLEMALEEAVASLETAGWEREAAEARAAEAERVAAATQAARAPPPLPPPPPPPPRRKRPPAPAPPSAGESARLRSRASQLDEALRSALEALDVRDAQALSARAALRPARAEREAAQRELAAAQLAAAGSAARLQVLHRLLGGCLAVLAMLLLVLLW